MTIFNGIPYLKIVVMTNLELVTSLKGGQTSFVTPGTKLLRFLLLIIVPWFLSLQDTIDDIIGMFLLPKDIQLQKYVQYITFH